MKNQGGRLLEQLKRVLGTPVCPDCCALTEAGKEVLKQAESARKTVSDTYPEAGIHLTLDNKKLIIIEDRYDIAFRIGQVEDSNLIARKLGEVVPDTEIFNRAFILPILLQADIQKAF